MDDTSLPDVPWTEFLNDDYEDDAALFEALFQFRGDSPPNNDNARYITPSWVDAPEPASVGQNPALPTFAVPQEDCRHKIPSKYNRNIVRYDTSSNI